MSEPDLCPDLCPVLCIDIGGTSTKAGVLQSDGQMGPVNSIPTQAPPDVFVQNLTALIKETSDRTRSESGHAPKYLGIAVAGFLDAARNHLVYNANLPWLEGYPLRNTLRHQFPDLTIELEVDSNAATMAEYHFGCGKLSKRFLCLTVGTGLGVGMTVSGVPLRFAYGCMGDIGHTIVLRDGPLCTCGGRGCAEVMVSATTLAKTYESLTGAARSHTLRDVIAAGEAGDQMASSVLSQAGEWLGIAAASLANAFFPDHIAIAGGLSAAGDMVLKPAERVFRETACVLARSGASFSRASLGSTATLIGAAWPFWQDHLAQSSS